MWWILASCSWFGGESVIDLPAADPPSRPVARTTGAIALARGTGGTFTLPPSNRPNGEAAPDVFPPVAPFTWSENRKKADIYATPLPVLPNLLPSSGAGTHQFGAKEPTGFELFGPDGKVPFERGARLPGTYGFDEEHLYVSVEKGAPAPDASRYTIRFAKAASTENGLNLATSGLQPDAFARRSVTIGTTSWTGLYLPPPAEARLPLVVPERGRLELVARILAPAITSLSESDGAEVEIAIAAGGAEEVLETEWVRAGGAGVPLRADLADHAGESVELVLRTRPGDTATFDYVLLESPVVYSPREEPERVVLVFIDTLRPDHLGFNGYARDTSPTLDRLAAHAAVFTNARSVAPWTLPSARAVLSGRQPEDWYGALVLPEVLGEAGWRTDALVSNAFLSQPFDMQRGWDRFDYQHLLPAGDLVDRAVELLEEHADRDQLILVHFMEPHLPYDEPLLYRRVWAGSAPDSLESLSRGELTEVGPSDPAFAEIRQYVTDRYDQEILAVDAALEELFDAAGRRATVVVFSDHGEELWDHGSFEHGHSFYDELLRVPLVIRSPFVPSGRFDAPVSLLDVAPTVCEVAGARCDGGPGRSLVGLAWADPGEAEMFGARPQAFGRALYGDEGWGLLDQGRKWVDRAGVQSLYSLGADPGERYDLASGEPELQRWPEKLGSTLGREVKQVWRIELPATAWSYGDLLLAVSHPAGLADAWLAADPRGASTDRPEILEGRVQLRIAAGEKPPQALYVVPTGDPYQPDELVVSLVGKGVNLFGKASGGPIAPSHDPATVLRTGQSRYGLRVELQWVPVPHGVEVSGFHPDMAQQLRELGYLDEGD